MREDVSLQVCRNALESKLEVTSVVAATVGGSRGRDRTRRGRLELFPREEDPRLGAM